MQHGDTSLHVAAHVGHPQVVQGLIDAGADKEARDKVCACTVAGSAAWHAAPAPSLSLICMNL